MTKSPPTYNCPVEATLDVIGGKWKAIVLWWLTQGPQRFSALRRNIPGVSEKVLTNQLRELEADGVVSRKVEPSVPPRVEYALTETGRGLSEAMNLLCAWGWGHMERIGAVEADPRRTERGAAAD